MFNQVLVSSWQVLTLNYFNCALLDYLLSPSVDIFTSLLPSRLTFSIYQLYVMVGGINEERFRYNACWIKSN